MFRITTQHPHLRLKIDGNLVDPFVEELRAACTPHLEAGRAVQLELSGIGYAEASGVALLRELAEQGVELIGGTPFLRELLRGSRAPAAAGPAPTPPPRPASDELAREHAWIAALRRGDQAAREAVVRHHGPALLATARRFLPREEEAQDALREALWSAFDGIDALADGTSLGTWLHSHVVRVALSRSTACHHQPEPDCEPLLPAFTAGGVRVLDEADRLLADEGPGAPTETPELATCMRRCIDGLPARHRATLLLCDVEGFGLPEAASLLGLDLAEARRRLHHARQASRHLLGRALAASRGARHERQPA